MTEYDQPNPYEEAVTDCPKHGMQILRDHGIVGEHTGDPYSTNILACGCEIGALGLDPEDVFFVREGR